MRPPHLVHVFATFAPGGPQVRTAQLLNALGGAYRHTVCAMDGCFDARELLSAELDVETVAPPPKAGLVPTVRRLRALLGALAPDLLLTYNWGSIEAVLAGRTLGLAMLHHEDGFLPDEAAGFKRRRIWMRRAALRWPREVIVPSHRLLGIATELWRLSAKQVHLVPNGIHVETFPERDGHAELRAELGIPAGAFVVGGVGHLRGEKNPVRLVEAVTRMEAAGVHLLLLGDGPERARVEAAVEAGGLAGRVHLAGHVADPREHYRAMDAFCIPSDTEQMPVALLEAMAAALPVASTDVGDVRRMLPPEAAPHLVPLDAGAADALAAALDALAADSGLRASLGGKNRVRVLEAYTFEGMLGAYRDSYAAALG
ncbi:MAG: glycosyltransferase [Planctomycetota bacterium]